MTTWLNDESASITPARLRTPVTPVTSVGRGEPPTLRALDLAVAGLALLLVALPLSLAATIGRVRRQPAQGRHGAPFERLTLVLPPGRAGRTLRALGAASWPVLLDILRGRMAFVGPRLRLLEEPVARSTLAVRPGLINPWFIRRRTAVDFGTEADADAAYLAARSLRHDLGLLLRGAFAAALPAPAPNVARRIQVGDVSLDNLSMSEALARLNEMLDGTQARQVSFVNPACVNIAAGHRGYRRVLARAAMVLPDGIGMKIGSGLLGTPLKQNVNGTDLFPRLCEMLQVRSASLYLLGGQPGVAEAVAAEIACRWPGVRVAGARDGFFGAAEEGAVAAQVRASRADVLLVARGVPTQDLFIDRHLPLLGVKVAMGVGGLFDFVSGRIARAPLWMRETGLEWIYRLMQEPGRMWRRYLVGNFSFLLRIGLQRLGWRTPPADTEFKAAPPMPPSGAPTGDESARGNGSEGGSEGHSECVRAVIFATRRATADLPVPADTPAALLPLGCQTVIEQVMDRLLHAAIVDVDIVASDHPEALRELLGDGSRWGMRLRWHLVADPARPYGVLRAPVFWQARRWLIGHADDCPSADALLRLSQAPAWALHAGPGRDLEWSGWASLGAAQMAPLAARAALTPDLDIAGLAGALGRGALPGVLWSDLELTRANGSQALLRACATGGAMSARVDVPGSWVKTAWGAMSPQARVHPQARITGPVHIGAGCIVERGAEVGPGVVLSRNVLVSGGTRLSNCVVLPGSYVGAGLELNDAVVNGSRVRHVRLGVETVLPAADALLLDIAPRAATAPGLLPRLAAGLAWLLALPALAAHSGVRRGAGRAPDWCELPVVSARDEATQALHFSVLRCARPMVPGSFESGGPAGSGATVWALLAGLRDVAAGRRCWFGARPRARSQWYALRPEWQAILARTPVGLLHAPAWADDPMQLEEACAAADIYLAVQPAWMRALTVLRGLAPAQRLRRR